MTWVLGIALYFVIWWTVLFAVLPFGVRTQAESGEVVPGTPRSAPTTINLVRIALINTVVAAALFGIVWLAIEMDWFAIAEIARNVRQ